MKSLKTRVAAIGPRGCNRIYSGTWSYVIYIGLGYLDSHVVSTKFVIVISLLSLYSVILNHPVTGSMIVTAFRSKLYFLPFIHMTQVPIISTYILFHGIYSVNLAGNLPYFFFDVFFCVGKCNN